MKGKYYKNVKCKVSEFPSQQLCKKIHKYKFPLHVTSQI